MQTFSLVWDIKKVAASVDLKHQLCGPLCYRHGNLSSRHLKQTPCSRLGPDMDVFVSYKFMKRPFP